MMNCLFCLLQEGDLFFDALDASPFETYQTTRRYIPGDYDFNFHRCENLRSQCQLSEDGGSYFLRNVSLYLPNHTASYYI